MSEITHKSFSTFEHLQNLLGMFDNPAQRRTMTADQLEVITLARQHVSCAENAMNVLNLPLNKAEKRLKQVLILLAETYHETDWRPCLDGETTLWDWLETLV